ncbi:Cinnamoyl-CoA reductase 2 [Camellia lanceoleosa]|uniref:Cinnamoyl-CoA reductase 2 n=1 Tax=Camellia lanceoleosa TaxID=1840588 RepID=A0ACC0HVI8_9ERIC|nr:Cinnamoyl-CoA reductase 2 [Camellia lanceoleosa]
MFLFIIIKASSEPPLKTVGNEEKNGHLKKLENATENLKLFKIDMLEYEGLCSAIAGCTSVIHLTSPTPFEHIPIPNPEVEFVESAIKGTRNVLNACLKAKVKKVVVVSSVAAVMVNPNCPKDQPMDENCWSDPEFCKQLEASI